MSNNPLENRGGRGSNLRRNLATIRETASNMFEAAAIPLAMAALGIDPLRIGKDMMLGIKDKAEEGPESFFAGLVIGIMNNYRLIDRTLKNLDGKIEPGTLDLEVLDDGKVAEAQITCVDKRRVDKSGGAIAGGYAVFGAEFVSLITAGLIAENTPSNPATQAMVGFNVGTNALTGMKATLDLIDQISKIKEEAINRSGNPDIRIKIKMENHHHGCGAAAGFTNEVAHLAKFNWHNKLYLADIFALPTEVLGFIFVNGIISPAVALASRGQVSLSASLKHSEMER